jgi:16S rRNA G966 N2-methylase RsmD
MAAPKVVLPTKKVSEMTRTDDYCTVIRDLLQIPEFSNETDVREDFVQPLLRALGYSNNSKNKIERNIQLKVSALIVGRKKKSLERYSPDYVLNVNGARKWVIDAKGPEESVRDDAHISQAYSYSIHREVNVPFFVICNGEEFAVYQTSDQSYKPITVFKRYELDYRWQELYEMLSVEAIATRGKLTKAKEKALTNPAEKRAPRRDTPIDRVIVPRKQASPIHAGTHPYFTKRAWNVVREYILHFTEQGETVLDPYGGAGVTAIEAALSGRKGVHIDINPIANFMTEALAVPVDLSALNKTYNKILETFEPAVRKINSAKKPKVEHWFPKRIRLPKDADVRYLHEYHSRRQIAAMSKLRAEIAKIGDEALRKVFMLVFSSTLVKCNLGYHNTGRDPNRGGGDAGFLKYYRFQIPKHKFPEQDPVAVFKKKFAAMAKAKKEILKYVTTSKDLSRLLMVDHGSATDLRFIDSSSVDYVFTDPPYGSKISYLECSILWNAWLKLPVIPNDYKQEVISGGSLKKSDQDYIGLLQKSLNEIYRVLKPDRWFTIVFASENPKFWHAIRDYCINLGFEHVNTVCQPSDRKTVKKNQNPLTVFKGELVLNFRKRRGAAKVTGLKSTLPPKQYVLNSAELTMVVNGGSASIEQIMQDLIPKLWESGLLGAVSNEIEDINELLKDAFDYDKKSGLWKIRAKAKIGCHIPLESRIKFYLLSCLNRARSESREVTVDDIIMEVLPFLRNGITPSNQDIISELKKIAHSKDGQHWLLRPSGQLDF